MRHDETKSFLSAIATLTSVGLALVYWLAPAEPDSHRLYVLLIDCIPDAIVVLVTIPIVYWLFYRRGLTNMGDCPFFAEAEKDAGANRPAFAAAISTAGSGRGGGPVARSGDRQDLLLVVGAGGGSVSLEDAPNTLGALNLALRMAESQGMLVVFTLDRSTPHACSANPQGCCTMKTDRAAFSDDIYVPANSILFEWSAHPDGDIFRSPVLALLVSNPRIGTVYVAGGGPEHRVRAVCRALLDEGIRTVALQGAIAGADRDRVSAESAWQDLVADGLVKTPGLGASPQAS